MGFLVKVIRVIRNIFYCMFFMGIGIVIRGIFSSDPSDGNQITPAIVIGLISLGIGAALNALANKLTPASVEPPKAA